MQIDADNMTEKFSESLDRKFYENPEVYSKYSEVRTLKEAMNKFFTGEWDYCYLYNWYGSYLKEEGGNA